MMTSIATYPKSARLRSSSQYRWIQRQGQRRPGRYLLLQWIQTSQRRPCRLGLTVSAKYGSSVARNLFKRRMREIFRQMRLELSSGSVLHVKPTGKVTHADQVASYLQLELEFKALVLSLGLQTPPVAAPIVAAPIIAAITPLLTDTKIDS